MNTKTVLSLVFFGDLGSCDIGQLALRKKDALGHRAGLGRVGRRNSCPLGFF